MQLRVSMRISCLCPVLLFVPAITAFAQPSRGSERSASELASAFLDALTYASAGREKLDENHDAKEPLVAIGAEMTNQRIAKRRFADARELFVNELKSSDKSMNLVGVAMTGIFEALETNCDRAIALHEAMLKIKTQNDVAQVISQGSELRADVDEAWRMLPQAALALSFALLDEERLTDGKVQHLRISSADRAVLISRIKREYPNAQKQAGGHAIEVSASLVLKFLTGDHKSAPEQ